ncbi:MAG: rhomboid family intramembrane serine protease, partial [Propionibacteriaceae bacterium]
SNYAPAQCYRHPGTEAVVSCQRCDRPICTACMASAPVGFHCPACVAEGIRTTRRTTSPFGGTPSKDPRLTSLILIGINVAVWLLIIMTGWKNSPWIYHLAQSNNGICTDMTRYWPRSGSMCQSVGGQWFPGVHNGAPWQVITAAFTHVEIWHIAFNMIALYQLGPVVESMLGRARFLAVYLGSAITGALLVSWLSSSWTLGASGAIFGLMAALLIIVYKRGGDLRSVLIWLGVNAIVTVLGASGISWQGHLGGFLGGLALTAIITYAPKKNRTLVQWGAIAACILASLAGIFLS